MELRQSAGADGEWRDLARWTLRRVRSSQRRAPAGNVYSRPGHKCELLRDVVSNPLCARDSFQYQNFRLYRLAAVKRLPKKSHIDISTRPSGTIRSVGVAALSRHHVSSPRR